MTNRPFSTLALVAYVIEIDVKLMKLYVSWSILPSGFREITGSLSIFPPWRVGSIDHDFSKTLLTGMLCRSWVLLLKVIKFKYKLAMLALVNWSY